MSDLPEVIDFQGEEWVRRDVVLARIERLRDLINEPYLRGLIAKRELECEEILRLFRAQEQKSLDLAAEVTKLRGENAELRKKLDGVVTAVNSWLTH